MAYSAWSVSYGEQPSASKWNILGTNDASFNDGTGIASAAITPEKLVASTGTSWAYTSYSPTLTNVTEGNGTKVAYYRQIGKTVHYWGRFTLGSTSAMGTTPTVGLPVNLHTNWPTSGDMLIGLGTINDSGTASYPLFFRPASSSALTLIQLNAAGTYTTQNTVTGTAPMTWTTNDSFSWNIIYAVD